MVIWLLPVAVMGHVGWSVLIPRGTLEDLAVLVRRRGVAYREAEVIQA